jgi:hypothetical protein
MTWKHLRNVATVIIIVVGSLRIAQPALACSVCFGGDPNDSMAQGVQAGILVLLGVLGTVLTGLASMLIFWMRRAAHLEAQAAADSPPVLTAPPPPLSNA